MIHLTLQQLSAFLDCELSESSTELIRRHLSECEVCTLRFARLEAQEEVMVRILVEEPDDDFFTELTGSIAAQLPGGRVAAPAGRTGKQKPKDAARKSVASRPPPESKPAPMPQAPSTLESMPVSRPAPLVQPPPVTQPAYVPQPAPRPAPPATPGPEARPILYGRRAEDVKPNAWNSGRVARASIAAAVICVILLSAAWVGFNRGDSAPPAVERTETRRPSAPVESAAPDVPTTASAQVVSAPEPEPPVETPVETLVKSPVETPVIVAPEVSTETVPRPAVETSPVAAPVTASLATPVAEPVAAPEKAHSGSAKPKVAAPAKRNSEGSMRVRVPGRPEAPAASRSPSPEPEPERLVKRPTQNLVPVRTIITETMIPPADEDAGPPPPAAVPPAAAAPSPQANSAPARLLQEAKSASLRAAKTKAPAAFDDAAAAWERAMPHLASSPEDLAMARREVAQARFQAWAEAPSASRRESAVTAARAYLIYAPPGPERDQAWTWLARLKR